MRVNRKLKKKGFTLIEMVAVVAIIGILAAILVPKITGYMKEAKKTGVIDQARKITQAYETAEMKENLKAGDKINNTSTKTVSSITNPTMLSLLDIKETSDPTKREKELKDTFDKLDNAKIADCFDIVAGGEFTVTDAGLYKHDVQETVSR